VGDDCEILCFGRRKPRQPDNECNGAWLLKNSHSSFSTGHYTYPMKEDVKERSFSPSLAEAADRARGILNDRWALVLSLAKHLQSVG
jgi:hypothetical protein